MLFKGVTSHAVDCQQKDNVWPTVPRVFQDHLVKRQQGCSQLHLSFPLLLENCWFKGAAGVTERGARRIYIITILLMTIAKLLFL